MAIVLWLPDIVNAGKHLMRWRGFHLDNPRWSPYTEDDRFTKWVERYVLGSWEIENGPKHYIGEAVEAINGLTIEVVGVPLYKHPIGSLLTFPAAENSHGYQEAHANLYGHLIDGLSKECLEKVATHLGRNETYQNDKTLSAVSRLMPQLAEPSRFAAAMSKVSEQRRLASHAVRPPAERFPALSTFTRDLEACLTAIRQLQSVLEALFGMDATVARKRHEAKARLPKLERSVNKSASISQAAQMVGKTVANVEFGEREEWIDVHKSEGLILHFTDDSILAIDTGSNVSNVVSKHRDLRPEEVRIDLRLNWVPAFSP